MIQSLARGMAILECAGQTEDGITLSQAAEHLEVKLPTAHNLVQTLLSGGYLEKVNGKRYRIGPSLLELARDHQQRPWLEIAGDRMQALAKRFPRATITMSQCNGRDISVALRVSPELPGKVQRPEGRIVSVYAQITGLVVQAFSEYEDLLTLREEHSFYAEGHRLWSDLDNLEKFLAQVRKDGVGVFPFKEPEYLRAAAPVYDRFGRLRCVVGVSIIVKNSDIETKAVVESLLETAKDISENITH